MVVTQRKEHAEEQSGNFLQNIQKKSLSYLLIQSKVVNFASPYSLLKHLKLRITSTLK
ncbi:hypothetical protein I79_020195 [Cricetulus griseus]|uniref:Uncharacterized protein n=1 Tax=Cricetulus griseus TaxID=10029 RepID=G3I9F3_CRIGR|nr:hypothetical protein I79_020195 [Cricetulus griseus]